MDSHLASILARMNSRFEEHMACGLYAGLPTPLLAAVVDQGPEAVGFYGLALCIGAAGAESKLSAMQANWCREILGCQGLPQGPHSPLLAECGASRRIGTRMFGAALMLEARIWSSELSSPSRRQSLGGIPSFPDWLETSGFDLVSSDSRTRKHLLSRYKVHIVEPALSEYDNTAFVERSAKSDWPYIQFQPRLEPLPRHVLLAQWSQYTWQDYKIWSLGAPLAAFHGHPSVSTLHPRCSRIVSSAIAAM